MTGIIEEIVDTAEDIAEAVLGDVEHVFAPRPGGKIDTARRNAQREPLAGEPVAQQDYLVKGRPVAVDALAPDTAIARTVTLGAANPVLPLLPRDSTRRSAVILAVDNDVYLTSDPGAAATAAAVDAASAQGVFYLPAGIAIPWQNTDRLFAAATTQATSSRISVIASFAGIR
jgi:hypothetical protein